MLFRDSAERAVQNMVRIVKHAANIGFKIVKDMHKSQALTGIVK